MNQARSFVQSLGASGSTNIDQALDTALKMVAGSDRTSYIIHLSDGIPTVGERDEQRIVANATKANSRRSRIFNVGVGYDVNSKLINRLSAACFGQSFYVAPEENVEATVSALYDRLGQPALSDVRWSFVSDRTGDAGDVKLQSVYPFQLADLFSGDEASVAGRFEGTGRGKLVFTGKLSGKEVRYEQTIDLDQASPRADGSYVASIWASRRAAGIIDEIDLEGRKDSLIKELVELARKYGILTEYTAFLAEEPMGPQSLARGAELAEERLGRLSLEAGQDAFRQRSSNMKMSQSKNIAQAQEQQLRALGQSYDGAGFNAGGTGGFGGSPPAAAPAANLPGQPADAVKSSILGTTVTRTEGRMAGGPLQSPVRQAGDRAFFLRAGQWVDSRIQGDVPKTAKKIPRFSDEYFAILEKHHDLLATMLDAEEPIVVELDNQVYIL
jgi:Ca-activated chloride channel family protein